MRARRGGVHGLIAQAALGECSGLWWTHTARTLLAFKSLVHYSFSHIQRSANMGKIGE